MGGISPYQHQTHASGANGLNVYLIMNNILMIYTPRRHCLRGEEERGRAAVFVCVLGWGGGRGVCVCVRVCVNVYMCDCVCDTHICV